MTRPFESRAQPRSSGISPTRKIPSIDAGHFAMDTAVDEVAELTEVFLTSRKSESSAAMTVSGASS